MDQEQAQKMVADLEVEMMADMYNRYVFKSFQIDKSCNFEPDKAYQDLFFGM